MVAPRQKITAAHFNKLADDVNELFGDKHAGKGPSDNPAVQDDIRWGWGGENIELIAKGQKVTASFTNEIVNRVNISTLRTNSSDQELVIVQQGEKVTAEFINTVESLLESARNVRNEVDPSLTTLSTLTSVVSNTSGWHNRLESVIRLDFGGYESARHFFNAGGDIRLVFSIADGYGAGYSTWGGIFMDQGTLRLNVETMNSLNNRGVSQDIGFSEIVIGEQLLYTSPTGGGSGYGGYGGYGGYASSRLKVYGNIVGDELQLRTLLDHAGIGTAVNGTITMTVLMSHPTTVTENDVTLELPTPTVQIHTPWHAI